MTTLRVGFIPLVDSAVLVAAARRGFAAEAGIALELVREASWATVRDKLTIGHIDCAHMLAPVPIASQLQIGNPKARMVAPFTLSMNGNAISVSNALHGDMEATGLMGAPRDAAAKARALKAVVDRRARRGEERLTFGTVHPFSPHNYELRYWLASAGIHPDRDMTLVVIPPPFVVDYLREGHIDGFCVGAPWNSVGIDEGVAKAVVAIVDLWHRAPEKVLGVREAWADAQPETLDALLRALKRAAEWAEDPANVEELTALLAAHDVIDMDPAPIRAALTGRVPLGDDAPEPIPGYLMFDRGGASFPWRSHALWFYSQMVRWGQAPLSPEGLDLAGGAFRPDIYRRAFKGTGVALPSANAKVEGSLTADEPVGSTTGRLVLPRDGFFDGRIFDPTDIKTYVDDFAIDSRDLHAEWARTDR
ncbi:CmpA/NrtA family ABC transporter substrate-binding protein [Acuticoccus sp. I52.16.1]|uniref:CmpA/NrtA family ABC transporter substrate-binding protein n=1 Tax=Acuticoccus sp. I52.16.1 TaxID=2928472 RepID=UPI001FD0716B|nr:CmpA/NrtA family ABC transporter substrate-binding protein [Acuticoccus sp. I52.16.1]UOM33240.1 ABC transporter substrate-binding protein [Acuticoccus sp. I52.16.1]